MPAAAGSLALLCGICAFLFLVLRDHGHPRLMVNEQAAPRATAALVPKTSTPASQTPAASVAAVSGSIPAGRKEFHTSKAAGLTDLGPVKLRLTATDKTHSTFDVNVVSGRRAYAHRKLKMDEPFWISAGRGKGSIQLVVTAMEEGSVAGYWSESTRSARVSARSRTKHR